MENEKSTEEMLTLLKTALNQSTSGILIADAPDVKIIFANNAALGIRGDSDVELTEISVLEHAKKWQTFKMDGTTPYPPEDLPLSRAIFKGEVTKGEELIIRHDTEGDRVVYSNAAPIKNASGEIVSGVVVFHDITDSKAHEQKNKKLLKETKRLNKEVLHYNEDLKSLLYLASHDLKAPLVSIEGFSKELVYEINDLFKALKKEDLPKGAVEKIEKFKSENLPVFDNFVHGSVMDLYALINGMYKIAEVGDKAITTEDINVSELLMQVELKFNTLLSETGSVIHLENLPHCMADPTMLTVIFNNLISNAIKYRSSDRPCKITISGEEDGDFVRYHVKDNGIGIKEDKQAKVFNAFYRVKKSLSLAAAGHGLGLSLVSWACRKIGGEVSVESKLDEGTTFTLQIPIK